MVRRRIRNKRRGKKTKWKEGWMERNKKGEQREEKGQGEEQGQAEEKEKRRARRKGDNKDRRAKERHSLVFKKNLSQPHLPTPPHLIGKKRPAVTPEVKSSVANGNKVV